jgi:excisionase family DNA binding protein
VPEHLTPGEVAALFGVRRGAVRAWATSGKVESGRTPGGHRRYPSAQFADVIAAVTGAEHAA